MKAAGGSFVSFPALVAVGLPPVIANASSTVALFPGTVATNVASCEDPDRARVEEVLRRIGALSVWRAARCSPSYSTRTLFDDAPFLPLLAALTLPLARARGLHCRARRAYRADHRTGSCSS
jgi:hypothetical protein